MDVVHAGSYLFILLDSRVVCPPPPFPQRCCRACLVDFFFFPPLALSRRSEEETPRSLMLLDELVVCFGVRAAWLSAALLSTTRTFKPFLWVCAGLAEQAGRLQYAPAAGEQGVR